MEQRAVINFHAKLGKNASEEFWLMQQVYGDDCLNRANVCLWHKCFLEDREMLEDDNREARPISACSLYSSIVKELSTRNSFQLAKKLLVHIISKSLLHDNAPNHTSLIVRQFLARNQVYVLNHPPYSPDLAPYDSSLFPKLKLKGCFLMTFRPSKQLQHEH